MKPLSFMKFVMMESELFFAKVALVVGAMTLFKSSTHQTPLEAEYGTLGEKN